MAAGLLVGAGGGAVAAAAPDGSNTAGLSQGAEDASQGVGGLGQDAEGTSQAADTSQLVGLPTGGDAGDPDERPKVGALGNDSDRAGAPGGGDAGDNVATLTAAADEEMGTGATGNDQILVNEPGTAALEQDLTTAETETTPAVTVPAQATSSDSSATTAESAVAPPQAPQPAAGSVDWTAAAVSAMQPVSNAFQTWVGVASTVPDTVAALRTSPTPITDAIAAIESMLTTVVGAVGPLTQVPGDLYALFGVSAATSPATLIGSGAAPVPSIRMAPPAGAPLFGPQTSPVPPIALPLDSASLFGTMAPQPPAPTTVTAPARSTAPLAVSGTVPLSVGTTTAARSLFEHVIDEVLVPASLTALAAVVLPGLGGLLVVAAAGVRLGYRQAKAGLALRASGIARFAGPGPLGVARTGSLVTLRQRARGPRTARAVCPEASRKARLLAPVA